MIKLTTRFICILLSFGLFITSNLYANVNEKKELPTLIKNSSDPVLIDREVKGKVTDASGEPLIGVSVVLKGNETVGTMTNIDGEYSLSVPQNATLIFRFTGFNRVEREVGNQTQIDVVLTESNTLLDEVVVVGFGQQERKDITGAVSSIDMEDVLGDRPVTDAAKSSARKCTGITNYLW